MLEQLRVSVAAEAPVLLRYSASPGPVPPASTARWLWLCGRPVDPRTCHEAIARGAYDVLCASAADFPERFTARLGELLLDEPPVPPTVHFVAESDAARRVLRQLFRAAHSSQPVLITGETGTGKEVSARLVHEWSSRSKARFVPINCAAIPNDLMEGELFGYAKGAFSGATRRFDGQLMAGAGGTVFLDEIDDTPFPLQIKLLRVLEDRVVTRLGESEPQQVDFRIIAATNRDLRALMASGHFGADLYERLAIVSVHLPPLRARTEDLPVLTRHFIQRFFRDEPAARDRLHIDGVTPEAAAALQAYGWPGNIRELRNVIFEALVYKRTGSELLLSDLPRRVLRGQADPTSGDGVTDALRLARRMDDGTFNLRREVASLERAALTLALQRAGGNAARAAALLGEVGRGSASDPGGTVRAMMRRLALLGGSVPENPVDVIEAQGEHLGSTHSIGRHEKRHREVALPESPDSTPVAAHRGVCFEG